MSDEKLTLAQRYKRMSQGQKTALIGGVVVVAIFTLGTMLTEEGAGPKPVRPGAQKEALTVYNPGGASATEGVAASLEAARKELRDQSTKIKLLEEQAKQRNEQDQGADGQWSEISNLVAQVQQLQETVNAMGKERQSDSPSASLSSPLPAASPSPEAPAPGSGSAEHVPAPARSVAIQVVGSELKPVKKASSKKEVPSAYIPSGSNFEAVLLNGMDASTAIGANRNPTPALLRIKSDAILPNMFSFNVRECFVMVGGFGNMSTERVEMRTESMSCISEGGEVYEGKIEGYLVGEDGKAGARGRVVSKQGAVLAKSFMAGFVGGLGNAFTPQQVQSLDLTGSSTTQYQYPSADQVVGSGLSSGLSKSATALSQFYIKLAEQMFPVVELDAGRKMTIIMLKGVDLKMERKG